MKARARSSTARAVATLLVATATALPVSEAAAQGAVQEAAQGGAQEAVQEATQRQPRQPQSPPPASAPASSTTETLAGLLDAARARLRAGDPAAAHALLVPATDRFAGLPEFDYLLGIAALDSGRPSEAVIALERLLAVRPDDALARAEIGRAFLALQERDAARRELRAVAGSNLPPEVRDTIARYLDVLALDDGRGPADGGPDTGRRWRASVELSVGHDSNANIGSSRERWVASDGLALTPLASSRPQPTLLHEVSGQLQARIPINGRTDWTVGAQLGQRTHASQHNVDLGSVEVSTGLTRAHGPDRYTASLQVQQLILDDRGFRRAAGLLGQWQRDLDRATQVGAYAQLFAFDFAGQPVRDARRAVLGATVARGLGDRGRAVVVGNLYVGREASRRDVAELDIDLAGGRAAVNRTLADGWRGFASIGYESRRHGAPDGFFGITRRDRQLDLRLGADHDLGARWTLSPQLVHTRNASTLAPNDFRRTQIVVSVRYRF